MMEQDTDGLSSKDGDDHVLSLDSTFRDLQTTYLILSLVLSVGCGLLLIFLVWKKEYLQKPSHYLRCNLAIDDIIFTSCLIPFRTYLLFQQDVSGQQLWCTARMLVAPTSLASMFGTYLMMAVDLYHFVRNPLHYHDRVTTKRVIVGIITIRALSLFFGLGYVAFGGLPTYSLLCEYDPANEVSAIFKNTLLLFYILAVLLITVLYYCVFKEARRQQERDENRDLWIFQTKAFKMMAPHATVLTVSVATIAFQLVMGRALIGKEHMSQHALYIADHVAILLFLTVSSIANPIIYSFRLPEFRRACKELCGLRTNQPVAPAPRHRDVEMAAITGPGQTAPATGLAPALSLTSTEGPQVTAEEAPSNQVVPGLRKSATEFAAAQNSGQKTPPEDVPYDQAQKQTTQPDMSPGQAPCTAYHGWKTPLKRPVQLTVRAEVHAEPTSRSGEDVTEALPGQLHLDPESADVYVPTPTLDSETDQATEGHAMDQFALKSPPARPKTAWQEDTSQCNKGQP
ncbi:ADRB2 [Branchiostoma lanceolatum]|uniref:ADRB2 protein n=1 Tax=Branchiostoma lanceolatum TaxID=7740 RepID=A0A8K0EEY9_BRALA|nr:ADRB2 [Branchiostoma lanceolatum]